MATNFIQNGSFVDFTAGADVASGELVALGSLYGIATNAVANGGKGVLALEGVYTVPKTTGVGTAIAVGGPAYYDVSEGAQVSGDDESAANALCGHAIEAAGDDDATVKLRLLG